MKDKIIVAQISLKPVVNILSCFGFEMAEATKGENRSCMLLTKDKFNVFVEKGKEYLKVNCFVYVKGKRLTYSNTYVKLVDKEFIIKDRLNMVTGNLLEFGEFSEYKINVE